MRPPAMSAAKDHEPPVRKARMVDDRSDGGETGPAEYNVKISGGAFGYDGKVPEHVARKLMVVLMSGRDTTLHTSVRESLRGQWGSMGAGNGDRPALTIGEFVRDSEPKRHPDRITAIAVYLREYRGQDVFSPADIVEGFEEAGEPAPGNISRDLKWAVSNKWIAPKSDVRGGYFVTNSGMEAVAQKFPKQLIKRTQIPESRRRSGGRANDTES